MTKLRLFGLVLLLPALVGCSGTQSALNPTGIDAERINLLFWIMTVGGALLLLLVVVLTALAIMGPAPLRRRLSGEALINWLGIGLPVTLLTCLLIYGFMILRAGAQPDPADGSLRITVSGELWWWRVTYHTPDGRTVESANEIHLPVGQPVALDLRSADVIHSFWAPTIAGKLDMIPGRTNTLTVTARQTGVTRGQCAEYCGGAHAFMAFHVVAQAPEAFEAWLVNEAAPARPAAAQAQGRALFEANGCGGCHTVRGTSADGTIGPDLTHVGSRHSLAAATLPNTADAIARFIVNNQHVKPENRMPEYGLFSDAEVMQIADYLESLE